MKPRTAADQWFKILTTTLLEPLGDIKIEHQVISETKSIDVWFVPKPDNVAERAHLGVLNRIAKIRVPLKATKTRPTSGRSFDAPTRPRTGR